MKYIFVDTNNLKYCSLQTKENNDSETLKDLKEVLFNNDDVKLLLPEVIELEYYRVVEESFVEKIKNKLGDLKQYMNMPNKLNFPRHLKQPIKDKIKKIKEERKESKERALEVFNKIINLKNTIVIPLTSDIMVKSEKRRIQNRLPSKGTHKQDQDCYIIESLISYVNNIKNDKNKKLIFCSNDTDFLEKENGEYNKLHKDIREDLNIETIYYRLLPDMIDKEFDKEIDENERENIEQLDRVTKIEDIISQVEMPSEKLQETFAQMEMPSEKLQETFAQMEMPSEKLQETFAQIEMPSEKLQETFAQMEMPSDKLQEAFSQIEMPSKKSHETFNNNNYSIKGLKLKNNEKDNGDAED